MHNKRVGVLLAAGHGRRFGGDKLLASLPDGTPIALAAAHALRAGLGSVFPDAGLIAVLRPEQDVLAKLLEAEGFRIVHTAAAERGMGASLAAGIAATANAQGWIVALADMPWLQPDTVTVVARALQAGATIAAPMVRGRRGHPVGFATNCGRELLQLDGDEGARALLTQYTVTAIECADEGALRDIDRPEDLS